MDRVLLYLEASRSSEERELTKAIKDRGGPEKVRENQKLLREVFDIRVDGAGISGAGRRESDGAVDEFERFQEEIQEGFRASIHKNMAQFQAKFTIQERQLEEMQRSIIAAVNSGPHDKIQDPVSGTNYPISISRLESYDYIHIQVIRKVWEEMVRFRMFGSNKRKSVNRTS